MATIKAILRPYVNSEGEQSINIRISHKGKNKFINTGVTVSKKLWFKNKVKKTHPSWLDINTHIENMVSNFMSRVYSLESTGHDYTVEDIITSHESKNETDFIIYAEEKYLKKFEIQGKYNSYKRIKSVLKKLKEYTNNRLRFDDISVSFIHDYESYLLSIGNNRNTVNSNLNVIRTILYLAIREGQFDVANNPFFNYTMKKAKVYKDKLSFIQIQKIIDTEVDASTLEQQAKDFFLACYFLAGMRFGDLATLKGENFQDGKIEYSMNKTGRRITLNLDQEIQKPLFEILNRYDSFDKDADEYLFPILEGNLNNEMTIKQAISSANAKLNKALTKVIKKAEINKTVGFHIARHSFADISRIKGVDIYDISKLMGHSSIKQTENYLASIDTDSMDKAFIKAYE